MQLPRPNALQKMLITAVDKQGQERSGHRFEAMFNPSEYTLTYRNRNLQKRTLTPTADDSEYGGQDTQTFQVRLYLDGTGAAENNSRATGGNMKATVQNRVDTFLKTCYEVVAKEHQPNRLRLQWGIIDFHGRLQHVQVRYTLFDNSGIPLRAELDCHFIGESIQNAVRQQDLSSPDLTHIRQVKAGDTLPLMAKAIYGSSRYYLLVAQANGLDDFRNLQPGTKLYFPPLNPVRT